MVELVGDYVPVGETRMQLGIGGRIPEESCDITWYALGYWWTLPSDTFERAFSPVDLRRLLVTKRELSFRGRITLIHPPIPPTATNA